jgi:hypothetical protein
LAVDDVEPLLHRLERRSVRREGVRPRADIDPGEVGSDKPADMRHAGRTDRAIRIVEGFGSRHSPVLDDVSLIA